MTISSAISGRFAPIRLPIARGPRHMQKEALPIDGILSPKCEHASGTKMWVYRVPNQLTN
jgi:hypothetical protein